MNVLPARLRGKLYGALVAVVAGQRLRLPSEQAAAARNRPADVLLGIRPSTSAWPTRRRRPTRRSMAASS